jgi:hypothetical protein
MTGGSKDAWVDVVGWLRFPVAIQVTPGCLAKPILLELAGRSARLLMPRVEWIEERPAVVAPDMPPEERRHISHWHKDPNGWGDPWGKVSQWNPGKRKIITVHVSAALIRFRVRRSELTYSQSRRGRGHPTGEVVDRLFREIGPWMGSLRNWIEVMVDQDLDPDHPLQDVQAVGSGLGVLTVDAGVISSPAWPNNLVITARQEQPITLPALRRAATLASSSATPSDARLLLRDASAALKRGNRRRAIIEAGTALEVALADLNRTRLKQNIGGRPTLGTHVQNERIARAAGLPRTTQADVVTPRNDAIHNNIVPGSPAVTSAINVVLGVLNRVDPVPS